ncbi:hypothetical protein ADL22_11160 [Streptomyces sp. NRRL F-4489]|uniref:hypothetical protein n=1 Tax=Streptomyces sp. NRRL F-4489 TaxID=1609095 RepID=UPI00074900BB|nr:hypothetical protein [Streptomyces sp. NRRL F-4489]KUL46063.1 hypothetical protein ADL22_11160 [Streptomyces sp. NRRL F-4489]
MIWQGNPCELEEIMSEHPPPGSEGRARRSGWAIFGIVLAVVLALCGLLAVGFAVFLVVGLNNWASTK